LILEAYDHNILFYYKLGFTSGDKYIHANAMAALARKSKQYIRPEQWTTNKTWLTCKNY